MTNLKNIQTLAKTGRFDGCLEEKVRMFRKPMTQVLAGARGTLNYAAYSPSSKDCENSYFLLVSQHTGSVATFLGYNAVLTVTSYSKDINKIMSNVFESDTGISLNLNVPDSLKDYQNKLGFCLKLFERDSIRAMHILRNCSFNVPGSNSLPCSVCSMD